MTDKILEGYLADFASQFDFEDCDTSEVFLHFVNYCILSRTTSDSFDVVDISTDGRGDTGIDGAAILVDGHIVRSCDDVDYFRDQLGRLDVEFVFIRRSQARPLNFFGEPFAGPSSEKLHRPSHP